MFNRIIDHALRAAGIEPSQFDAEIVKAKYKNRMDWFLRSATEDFHAAYNERVRQEKTANERA